MKTTLALKPEKYIFGIHEGKYTFFVVINIFNYINSAKWSSIWRLQYSLAIYHGAASALLLVYVWNSDVNIIIIMDKIVLIGIDIQKLSLACKRAQNGTRGSTSVHLWLDLVDLADFWWTLANIQFLFIAYVSVDASIFLQKHLDDSGEYLI